MFRLAKGKKNIGLDLKILKIGKSFWFQDSSEGSESDRILLLDKKLLRKKKKLEAIDFFQLSIQEWKF